MRTYYYDWLALWNGIEAEGDDDSPSDPLNPESEEDEE